jgi:hypothetical protein
MNAIIISNGSVDEIAALVLTVQERQLERKPTKVKLMIGDKSVESILRNLG